MSVLIRGVVLTCLLAGCARIAEPPGGPPDSNPPKLLSTLPDSITVLPGFRNDAEFRFDEVVSEGTSPNFGLGSGDLEKLIILSPSPNVPRVSWKRRRITVKPREGWQPNRTYRIELLPGVVDLRNNRSQNGQIITFTTGSPVPERFLEGRVVDWTTAKGQTLGLVVATLLPDSLEYRTLADSTGRFRFGPLPDGEYLVAGAIDQNRNSRRDLRESFDTIRVAAGSDSVGEIWAFRHDTVPARIQSIARNDSLSVVVTFTQQLNPYQQLPASAARVRLLPDSIDLGVDSILPKPKYDSAYAPRAPVDTTTPTDSMRVADSLARVRADSVARADSVLREREAARRRARGIEEPRPPEPPLTTKPPLDDKLVIRVREPLRAGARYVVEIDGVENVSRVAGRAVLGFQVPEDPRPAADTSAADSTRAPGDSIPPDSLPARPDTAGVMLGSWSAGATSPRPLIPPVPEPRRDAVAAAVRPATPPRPR
ncbi:MAG: Ig-like domain-containing protein [Gemmatimonadales bacterium]